MALDRWTEVLLLPFLLVLKCYRGLVRRVKNACKSFFFRILLKLHMRRLLGLSHSTVEVEHALTNPKMSVLSTEVGRRDVVVLI